MRPPHVSLLGGMLVLLMAFSAEAELVKKSRDLCHGIKAEVEAVALAGQKNKVRKVVDYALDGARNSCRTIHEQQSGSQTNQRSFMASRTLVEI